MTFQPIKPIVLSNNLKMIILDALIYTILESFYFNSYNATCEKVTDTDC
jgi:hypothetical protein